MRANLVRTLNIGDKNCFIVFIIYYKTAELDGLPFFETEQSEKMDMNRYQIVKFLVTHIYMHI